MKKNAVQSRSTAEAYGDGENTVIPLIVPLGDQELGSFDSSLGKVGFIAGGLSKMFMNLGASMGLGRIHLSLVQRIPELPSEYLKSIIIKRVFFYIEPTKDSKRRMPWFQRFFNGRDDVNFDFIDKIGVKIQSRSIENMDSWTPIVSSLRLDKTHFYPLETMLKKDSSDSKSYDPQLGEEIVLMKYQKEKKDKYLRNDNNGKIIILSTTNPVKTRRYLTTHPLIKSYLNRVHILNDSVLVELIDEEKAQDQFQEILSENGSDMESLEVKNIEACSKVTCLDLNTTKLNLVPLISRLNGIQLDGYIDAEKYPDSFKLKGFIEFEIKLKLSF